MVSKPYPIQSKANPSKKSNPIFITQQNLHAIQMAFLNENFYLDWNPTQLCWALIGSVQSMDFFQSSPLTALSTLYICPLSSTTKNVTKTLVLIQSHYAEFHQIIETILLKFQNIKIFSETHMLQQIGNSDNKFCKVFISSPIILYGETLVMNGVYVKSKNLCNQFIICI